MSDPKALELKNAIQTTMKEFPYLIEVKDWTGDVYQVGKGELHWHGTPFRAHLKTRQCGLDILGMRPMRMLDAFVAGDMDIDDNLYLISDLRNYARLDMSKWEFILQILRNSSFQDKQRARINVKSHYDIPQEALNTYLDQVYMSYSCAMWEDPLNYDLSAMLQAGQGERDDFDSLEKAQWRKFKDAVDYIAPKPGETLLDIGCGYAGQLAVALENHPFGKVTGWTHSSNQVREGMKLLRKFDADRYELNEGDYREDQRVYDHITSTGMVSHVGPRGLVPYVKNVRQRIKTGGRYVHHALMIPEWRQPMDREPGIAFNKKYVWPGFHWFTVGDHVKALEQNGFEITRSVNLSQHYAKTTASWYERMMQEQELMKEKLGEQTFRAWRIYLAGASEAIRIKKIHVYRIYCEAV